MPSEPTLSDASATVALDDAQSHHARRVLRVRVGDRVGVMDGRGARGEGAVSEVQPVVVVLLDRCTRDPAPRPVITVAAAIPKGSHADEMVVQLSQLGADWWIPLRTARSVVDARSTKLDRLTRLAQESAKQCGRTHWLEIGDVTDLPAVLPRPAAWRLLASPEGDPALPAGTDRDAVDSVLLLIGPEGGWTDAEVRAATDGGFRPWRFAPHVLRIETAAAAAVALLRYHAMLTCSPAAT